MTQYQPQYLTAEGCQSALWEDKYTNAAFLLSEELFAQLVWQIRANTGLKLLNNDLSLRGQKNWETYFKYNGDSEGTELTFCHKKFGLRFLNINQIFNIFNDLTADIVKWINNEIKIIENEGIPKYQLAVLFRSSPEIVTNNPVAEIYYNLPGRENYEDGLYQNAIEQLMEALKASPPPEFKIITRLAVVPRDLSIENKK